MIEQIILDLDGVLANFCKSALEVCGHDKEIKITRWNFFEDFGFSEKEFWESVRGESFWLNLEVLPWANDLLDYIKNTQISFIIATSPCKDPYCYAAKAKWVEKYFDINYVKDVMMGSRKYLMANHHTVLVDDSEKNCEKFINRGGHSILFPANYNKNSELVGHELEYVKGRLENLLNNVRN